MASEEFFRTIMGRKYYEGDFPRMVDALEAIAKEMKRANDLKEKEIQQRDESGTTQNPA